MSDDEADPELLALLRQHLLGVSSKPSDEVSSHTGVLKDAEHIYDNSIDVFIDMYGTKAAAAGIHKYMQERNYSTAAWSEHELHPKTSEGFSDIDMVNFIFTMDLLNFSFWSELPETDRFHVEYRGKLWTGYNSLLAALRRALDDGVPITTPRYWSSHQSSEAALKQVFRSATDEEMPLLNERISMLREAAEVLNESFGDPEDTGEAAPNERETGAIDTAPARTIVHSEPTTEAISAGDGSAGVAKDNAASAEAITLSTNTTEEGEAHPGALADQTPASEIEAESTQISSQDAPLPEPVPLEHTATPQVIEALVTEKQIPLPPDYSIVRLIEKADHSAGKLVNLLAKHFPSFRDEARFDGKRVRLLKRAQIFVADLWAAFNGTGYGEFYDIDELTMFADYRVPQMLHSLGVLSYSPPLLHRIRSSQPIDSGHSWEVQLRGCSIWAVESMRREILRSHPEAQTNAVLIDFVLYDLAKEREAVSGGLSLPHHRTRSIWY